MSALIQIRAMALPRFGWGALSAMFAGAVL